MTINKGGVYFILAYKTRLIKIGYTGNILDRFQNLQRENADELILLTLVKPKRKEEGLFLEKQLHRKFLNSHHRGEWFRATPEIRSFIKQTKNSALEWRRWNDLIKKKKEEWKHVIKKEDNKEKWDIILNRMGGPLEKDNPARNP